ncbi:MAG: MarR family transcriptional regulator [Desulfurococcaceae archaeon]
MSEKSLSSRVLDYISSNPGATVKEICRELGLSPQLVSRVIQRLKAVGYVEKVGSGYRASGRGVELVDSSRSVERAGGGEGAVSRGVELEGGFSIELDGVKKRVEALESKVSELSRLVKSLNLELESIKKYLATCRQSSSSERSRRVMEYGEASALYGDKLQPLIYSGKLIRVGNIVVDQEFYRQFIGKFPIKLGEVDELSDEEKALLEALKESGEIYLHAGKEYRLISLNES